MNRGDTRGAFRLAAFVLLTFLGMWMFRAHHLASANEFDLILILLSWAVLAASLAGLWYLALDPFVRRREPHTLISWSRLMGGQFRDPLVGSDLLLGTLYGIALVLYETADNFVLPWLGKLPPMPGFLQAESLLGVRFAIGLLLYYALVFVLYALFVFFLLFLLRLALRKDWLAMIAVVGLFAVPDAVGEYPVFGFVAAALLWLSILLVLKRFGLLVLVTGLVVQNVLIVFPATTHLSEWFAAPALVGIFTIALLAAYGFHTSLAGQKIFSVAALDE